MEGEIKKSAKASKIEEKASKTVNKMQKYIQEGLCDHCRKTKKCEMYAKLGPTPSGARCVEFDEK